MDNQQQPHKTAAEALETSRTCAHAGIAEAQDVWTAPREAAPLREDMAPPAPAAWGETWSRQAVVARILRWRVEGMTKTAIAARLNAAHVPPLAGTGSRTIRKVNSALLAVPKSKRERHAFLARYAPTTAPALGRKGEHTGAPRP